MSFLKPLTTTIPEACHGQRFDAALASLFPQYSRSLLSKWIKEGFIKLNGEAGRPKEKVHAGDIIDIAEDLDQNNSEPSTHQAQDIPLNVIYEDEDILVINKPAGLVVHPGAGNRENTLLNALLFHCPALANLPRAGIIHRLDKDTTGLMVIAKSLLAQTELVRQMQAREIQRHYQALAQGYIVSGGIIETCFGRHPRNRLKMAVISKGREAITYYSINRHFIDYTLLDVKLMTGRTHQIRVHLAHINHPVLGDQLYAGRVRFPKNADAELRQLIESFKRQALHAYTLSFNHPINKKSLTFTAPLPDDFLTLVNALEKHDEDNPS